jgi:methionine-rich copper-binding protein CopC
MKPGTLILLGSGVVALMAIAAVEASAHSFPQEQSPAAGQTLATAPPNVSIKYDAQIEHLFAQLHVVGADGNDVVAGSPEISGDGYTLTVKVPPLKPGEYTVKWSVVCIDTHHTQGSYSFSVAGQGS